MMPRVEEHRNDAPLAAPTMLAHHSGDARRDEPATPPWRAQGVEPMSESASPAVPPSATPPHGDPFCERVEGLKDDLAGDEAIDRRLAEMEMAGEEVAAGWKPAPHRPLAPEVRYLHVSRTIHQLITDRNRSVGIFLAVASLLCAASSALLNARADVVPIIPLRAIQYWCLPVTFGTLAVIGIFNSLLLIRARIGLIYEASKMNTLLGLPNKRVERVNPLSIFYLMHLLVVLLGGASAGLSAGMLGYASGRSRSGALATGLAVGLSYLGLLQALYYLTILRATTESKLNQSQT
jgi:hypothetical protein